MHQGRTLWLGRVRSPVVGGPWRWVQVWTNGGAPQPSDRALEIENPWEVDVPAAWREGFRTTGWEAPLESIQTCPPVRPSKILGVGRNFRAHAAEMGTDAPAEPLLFFKPPSALVTNGDAVRLPRGYERIDMEAEVVVVIGTQCRNLGEASALAAVLGYTVGNDVSCRDLQRAEPQWARAKGFDTFCGIAPWVRLVEPGVGLDGSARIRGYYDDVLRQDESIAKMVFSVAQVIAHISQCMTLERGDLIYMGTPEGVTALHPGGTARVEMSGIDLGRLTNPIAAAD